MRLPHLWLLVCCSALAAPPRALPKEEAAVVKGDDAFAAALYQQLAKKPGSFFFSPHSMSTALAMTWAGARGETAAEMAKALHFDTSVDLHLGFSQLQKDLRAPDQAAYRLSITNKLFAEKHFSFLDAYLKLVRDRYLAPVELLDFKKAADRQRVYINGFVEKETEGRIHDLLAKGQITEETRLVLVNAIYFKGTWEQPFDPALTRPAPFTLADGKKVDAPTMSQKMTAGFGERDGVTVAELPYKGGDLSMVLLLPAKADGLPALEAKLAKEPLDDWLGAARMQKVLVHLPKFRLESAFSMVEPLQALGMKAAFDCNETTTADFSGMTGKRDLCVSAVVHKAFVEVNELGTEAAAATAVVMAEITAVEMPPPTLNVDHPFLFALLDRRTGAVLFLGRMMDPTAK